MQLEHSFTVPVGVDEAWKVLLDIERVAPCMPGAALETVDGDDFTGTVKVKLGPISLTYKGKASFVEKDEAAHRAVINAQGRDARGNGTASAKVSATLTDQSGQTKVDVLTDLDITGKPAQFGRGVMVDVGNKLIGQFADCLAGKLTGDAPPPAEPQAAPAPAPAEPTKKTAAKKAPAKKRPSPGPTAATPEPAPAAEPTPEPASATEPPAAAEPAVEPAPDVEPAVEAAPAADIAADAATPAPDPVAAAPTGLRTIQSADVEPIDLLEHAGPAVAKRLAPIFAAIVVLLIILRQRKR